MHDDDMEFECESCGAMFRGTLYAVDRELERVGFGASNPPVVSIRDSENIANFCSTMCRERGRAAVMAAEGVPIQRVGVEPIEPCAKCGKPVDLTGWHLTYLDSDTRFCGSIGQTLGVDYLAVVCSACSSKVADGAVELELSAVRDHVCP